MNTESWRTRHKLAGAGRQDGSGGQNRISISVGCLLTPGGREDAGRTGKAAKQTWWQLRCHHPGLGDRSHWSRPCRHPNPTPLCLATHTQTPHPHLNTQIISTLPPPSLARYSDPPAGQTAPPARSVWTQSPSLHHPPPAGHPAAPPPTLLSARSHAQPRSQRARAGVMTKNGAGVL